MEREIDIWLEMKREIERDRDRWIMDRDMDRDGERWREME